MKKKDTPAPDDKETASPVVEAEVITESESTDPPAGSYTIIGGDGDEYGPVSIEDVARWIRTDRANERTLVRSDEASQWQPLGQVPELALLLTGAPTAQAGQSKSHCDHDSGGGDMVSDGRPRISFGLSDLSGLPLHCISKNSFFLFNPQHDLFICGRYLYGYSRRTAAR